VILVLCEESDVAALWAADGLLNRGLPLTVLTGASLASTQRWRHTISADGRHVTVRLNGRTLCGRHVRAVLNRLPLVPRAWLSRIGGPDGVYAAQEMYAFYLSWLHSLAVPMLNPPTPQGLCGNMRHRSAWVALAARAGLPVHRFSQTSNDDPAAAWQLRSHHALRTVFVVGEEAIGPPDLAQVHRSGCLALARAAGCPLFGIDFARGPDDRWRVTTASVMPNIYAGGEAVLNALATVLTR
jgi:hypothetical protein